MMPRRRNILLILAVSALGIPAVVMQARVYLSGDTMGGDLFTPASFGSLFYKAMMQVNGGCAEVSLTSCEGGVASVRAAFAALRQNGHAYYHAGQSLGYGRVSLNGNTVSVVTLEPGPRSPVVMASVLQSDAEVSASAIPPVRHQLDDVPGPPDARVLSFMKNADTRTALERVSSRMSEESLAHYYEDAMRREGWNRMLRQAPMSGLSVYMKGRDICCVRIGPSDSDGGSRVTLLHKTGAVN